MAEKDELRHYLVSQHAFVHRKGKCAQGHKLVLVCLMRKRQLHMAACLRLHKIACLRLRPPDDMCLLLNLEPLKPNRRNLLLLRLPFLIVF